MQASESKIVKLLSSSNTQFVIPVYQRNYNWGEKQCSILLKDILDVAENNEIYSHFIGSVVYLHEGIYTTGKTEFSIIDGQQRITTLMLLLCALRDKAQEFGEDNTYRRIHEKFLIDPYMEGEVKIKLLPAGENYEILKSIIDSRNSDLHQKQQETNIVKNYQLFMENIDSIEEINKINKGLEKLIYVDIALENGKDDPQRIFESLNSTGLDLSQADLIRNFILMGLNREDQYKIYEQYWVPIEKNTFKLEDAKDKNNTSQFFRDYLTKEWGKVPNQKKVFEEFKNNYSTCNTTQMEKELLKIKEYSKVYFRILNPEYEQDEEIRQHLKYIKLLDQNVIHPFLMGIYHDYRTEKIRRNIFINILNLVENYIWRRYIVGEPSKGLNKVFMVLFNKIDQNNYYQSVEDYLVTQRFPNDQELRIALKVKPLYRDQDKLLYLLDRLENYQHNEKIDIDKANITIEHIFPQIPNHAWKESLSTKEYEKMTELKDTLANLTLTGSNSSLGNKIFVEKRDLHQKGYRDSKFMLNRWISQQEEWNLNSMDERFNELFKQIVEIWKCPQIPQQQKIDDLYFYCQGPRGSATGTMLKSNKFVILKGSKASKYCYDSAKNNIVQFEKMLAKGIVKDCIEYYQFLTDHATSSPSAAAKLILGRSSNGWTAWRTYEGEPLDTFRDKE